MNVHAAVEFVAKNFVYTPDKKSGAKRGQWKVLSGDKPMKGDCEDFSLTVIDTVFNSVLGPVFSGKAKIHHVMSSSGPHAVGSIGDLWFDNWTLKAMRKDEFFAQTKHKFVKTYSPVFVAWQLIGVWRYAVIAGVVGVGALAVNFLV